MIYIDCGNRDQGQTLASWFRNALSGELSAIRFQSGYFTIGAIGSLARPLRSVIANGGLVRAVIGSNGGITLAADVARLSELLEIPAPSSSLKVVSYSNGLFHPKTYHVTRADGSQTAYVGSANLTPAGLSGSNIEAGILLDTRVGDDPEVLRNICSGIDSWFEVERPGAIPIETRRDIDRLVERGVLSTDNYPRAVTPSDLDGDRAAAGLPPLGQLSDLPVYYPATQALPSVPPTPVAAPAVAPRANYPPYLLFDPHSIAPTSGQAALSGATLPNNCAGLILRINRDSGRRLEGRSGTANISVPVATINTIRFGIFQGSYQRPRAEFDLHMRYVSAGESFAVISSTNVMAYGFNESESGHGDIRLLVPAALDALISRISNAGLPLPQVGNVAQLVWPTMAVPAFQLVFLNPQSALYSQTARLFSDAEENDQLVGGNASWLPADYAV